MKDGCSWEGKALHPSLKFKKNVLRKRDILSICECVYERVCAIQTLERTRRMNDKTAR